MYRKILVPLDGSKLSECALEHARTLALGCSVPEVVLLTVVQTNPQSFGEFWNRPMPDVAAEVETEAKQARRNAEAYLARISDELKKDGITAKTIVNVSGEPHGAVEKILAYIKANKVDLIVMSTHGRSGISRWAFGSVTEKIIHDADVPVLTVAPAGCRVS